jgi:hypothetical protein
VYPHLGLKIDFLAAVLGYRSLGPETLVETCYIIAPKERLTPSMALSAKVGLALAGPDRCHVSMRKKKKGHRRRQKNRIFLISNQRFGAV